MIDIIVTWLIAFGLGSLAGWVSGSSGASEYDFDCAIRRMEERGDEEGAEVCRSLKELWEKEK